MKSIKKIFAFILVMLIILATQAFATTATIYLAENQLWGSRAVARTGANSFVEAQCLSVYPEKGIDLFTRIQSRATLATGFVISVNPTYTLIEGRQPTQMRLKDGYLNETYVLIQFRGNTNKPAYATVYYHGR